ncbi:MAG: hypothetical protein RQ751_02605 [Longimicrobiales bacterium]|nr:hypothetical protein [Longimicrobiales bacterium]
MRLRSLLALTLLAVPSAVHAQNPIQLSLFPPIQIVPEDEAVSGFRLGVYARNAEMSGLDLGLVLHSTGNASALQIGAVNVVDGDFLGVQAGWGAGLALANVTRGEVRGVQLALYNGAGTAEGFQLGLVNNTQTVMRGFQLSLVNIADDMNGLQVGLVNIIRSKENFPVLPLVNWKFN